MAERLGQRYSEPETYGDEDPLVELARIVAGRPGANGDGGRRRTDLADDDRAPAEADLARDLEAELLSDLQSSLGPGRRSVGGYVPPVVPGYGEGDYYAAEQEAEPGAAADGGEEYYASDYAGYQEPGYAADPDEGYAADGEPMADEGGPFYATEATFEPAAAEAGYGEEEEPAAEAYPGQAYEGAGAYQEAGAYGEPAAYGAEDDAVYDEDAADSGAPVYEDDAGYAAPPGYTAPSGYDEEPEADTTGAEAEEAYAPPAGEVAFGYMGLRRSAPAYDPGSPASARSAIGSASASAYDPPRLTQYGHGVGPADAFSGEEEAARPVARTQASRSPKFAGAEGYAPVALEPAYEPEAAAEDEYEPVPGYGEAAAAESLPPAASRRAPRAGRGRRQMIAVAAVLAVVFVGGAAALVLRSSSGTSAAVPPIIRADVTPTKIAPEEQPETVAANDPAKMIYERVAQPGSDAPAEDNAEIMLPQDDEPIADIPQTPQLADEGSRAISRIILPGAPGDDSVAPEPADPIAVAAAESAPAGDVAPVGPRRVRTVVVRPDGSIVSSEAEPADGTPAAEAPAAALDAAAQDPAPAEAAAVQPSPRDGDPLPRPNPGRDDEPAAAPQAAAAPEAAAPAARPVEAPARRTVEVTPVRPEPNAPAARQQNNAPISLLPANRQAAAPQQTRPAQSQPAQTQVAALPAGGGFYVQVGSQASQDAAATTYRDLQRRFPQLLGGRQPDIQRADLGARGTFYRVRVGPTASRDEAVRFCESLKAAGADCFVAQN